MKNPAPYGKGNDYMQAMHGTHDMPSQSVPEEMGNNGGPKADGTTEKGDIEIKGTPDFMGGTPDAAGK